MKVLLDNCMVVRFANILDLHEVSTCRDFGWQTISNGELLRLANDHGFELLITVDRNMRFQSSLAGLSLSVVVIDAPTNTHSLIRLSLAQLNQELHQFAFGKFHVFKPKL